MASAGADLENKGLVQVAEEGDGGSALEVMSPLAYASVKVSFLLLGRSWTCPRTYDRNVDFPHFSSPSSNTVMVCSSILMSAWLFNGLVLDSVFSSSFNTSSPTLTPQILSAMPRSTPLKFHTAGPVTKSHNYNLELFMFKDKRDNRVRLIRWPPDDRSA